MEPLKTQPFNVQPVENIKRRKTLLIFLYVVLMILLVVLVFLTVSYLLKKGEVFRPKPALEEFPASPASDFPPGPPI